jgi:hypothetical protein
MSETIENQEEFIPDPKRTQKLIAELGDRDERKVIGALKRVPHEGSPEVIPALLSLLAAKPSKEVQLLLEKSLFNLKDAKCIDPLIFALTDKKLTEIKPDILTCIWQSGLDASDELSLLIDIAISDDFLTAIEVLTIVDNTENYRDELLSENIAKLDQAITVKSDKNDLLGNLRQVLLEKLLG